MRPIGALYAIETESLIDSIIECSIEYFGMFPDTHLLTFGY